MSSIIKKSSKDTELDETGEFINERMDSVSDSVLGGFLKLSGGARAPVKALLARATMWVAKHGSELLADGIAATAEGVFKVHDPQKIKAIRDSSQKGLQYAIPFWEDIFLGAKTAKDYWSSMRTLGKNLVLLIPESERKKNVGGLLTSKNEIVQFERDRIKNHRNQNLKSMSLNVLERAPQIWGTQIERELKQVAEKNKCLDWNGQVDPDELLRKLENKAMQRGPSSSVKGESSVKKSDKVSKKPRVNRSSPKGESNADAYREFKTAKGLIKNLSVIGDFGTLGASAATAVLQEKLSGKEEEEKPSVLELIHNLKKEVDTMQGCNADSPHSTDPEQIATQIRHQVEEIFTTHQQNMGRGDLPKRLKDKFEEMVDVVTQAIAEGDMSACGLLQLAGEGKMILTTGKKIRDIAVPEVAQKEVRRIGELLPVGETVDIEAYFKEAPFSKDELKTIFESAKGQERAFLGTLFDKSILRSIGLSDKEIRTFNKKQGAAVYGIIKDRLIAVNALSTEEKKKLGMTSEDAEHVSNLVAGLEDGENEKALKRATRDSSVKRILANAALKGDKKLWTDIVSGKHDRKTDKEDMDKEEGEEKDSAMASSGRQGKSRSGRSDDSDRSNKYKRKGRDDDDGEDDYSRGRPKSSKSFTKRARGEDDDATERGF